MKTITKSLITLPFFVLPLAATAAPSTNVKQMQQQLDELKKRYEAQGSALSTLEARLHQMEKQLQAQNAPAKPVKTAAATQADSVQKPAALVAAASSDAKIGKDEVVREAPPSRSTEAVYQEQHALFDKRFTLETGLTYSRYDRKQLTLSGFLALDAIFLGDINVDTVKSDIWTLDVTGRYTLSDRLQVDLNAPFMYRNTVYQSAGTGFATTDYSDKKLTLGPKLGDISAGVYYQLVKESPTNPDIVMNVRLKAPTGSDPYGIKVEQVGSNTNLKVPKELPSGNGLWSASAGLSFVKTLDPAIVFANVSYFHNFRRHFSDISSDANVVTSGEIELGDSIQYGLGTAFALNERMSLSMSYTQRFTAKSRTKADGGDWSTITGSDANAAMLNFGSTYATSDRQSVVVNIGAGLTPDAPNATVGVKLLNSF